ncbi:MFS transporter [Plastorhodobacter daqingensis]|uniref:MFS transporter n=1 Tax=Plastorhodobacter daqingensis TaxID=1387281 RepID=A0ABW2UJ20_9RHOB
MRNGAVWALAVGQTLGYASLFYIFAALILWWEADLGWDRATLALGPMLAVALAGLAAPLAGRLVDRGLGPELLGAGPVLGAAALALLAVADRPAVYLAAWAGLGLAQGACLYEVCFAFLIRRFGSAARPAIIRVTLVAGFASTLAFPAGAALSGALGWRGAVWVAAAVVLGVMAPLQALAARAIRRSAPPPRPATLEADRGALGRALRQGGFWGLASVFALVSLNHWMLISFLVPVLSERGMSGTLAVTAASCVGPAQVAGRILLMRWESRIGTAQATLITMAGLVLGALLLLAAGLAPLLAFGFALVQGAALGVMTILRPILVAETLGQAGYGAIAGALSLPPLAASAAAPVTGAVLLSAGGAGALIGASLALAVAALAGAAILLRKA